MSVEIEDSGGQSETVETIAEVVKCDTPDVGLAAALRALGHKMMGIEARKIPGWDKKKVFFLFNNVGVKEDVVRWLNGELTVEPRAFIHTYEDLRNIVRNKKFLRKQPHRGPTPPKPTVAREQSVVAPGRKTDDKV